MALELVHYYMMIIKQLHRAQMNIRRVLVYWVIQKAHGAIKQAKKCLDRITHGRHLVEACQLRPNTLSAPFLESALHQRTILNQESEPLRLVRREATLKIKRETIFAVHAL